MNNTLYKIGIDLYNELEKLNINMGIITYGIVIKVLYINFFYKYFERFLLNKMINKNLKIFGKAKKL